MIRAETTGDVSFKVKYIIYCQQNDEPLTKLSNKTRRINVMFTGGARVTILLDIALQRAAELIGYSWKLSSLNRKVWKAALETNFLQTILFSRLYPYWIYDSSENQTDIARGFIQRSTKRQQQVLLVSETVHCDIARVGSDCVTTLTL